MQLRSIKIEKPDEINFILGQSHFIKTVEDLHEALVTAVPGIRFGLAFCEASGKSLIRWSGNDDALLTLAKRLGKDQALSLALWDSGWYEARLLASLVGDPKRVTRRQMDAWAKGCENWADCDTACFKLFDQVPFAWEKAD